MASIHAKAVRRAEVLQRLSDRLGVEQANLYYNARGDSEMELIITLERIADAVEEKVTAPRGKTASKGTKAMQDKEEEPSDAPATKEEAVQRVETDLEEDTGKDFVETGKNPPTLAETDEQPGNSEVFSTPPKAKK
jgi:hypothetical protein